MRHPAIVLGCAALAASVSVPASAAEPPPQDNPYGACMALARTAPEDALAQAEALSKAGAEAPARHCVATAMLSLGKPAQAAKVLDDLTRDLGKAPADQRAELAAQAGRAWLTAGDAAKAVASFTQALAALPDSTALLIERAVANGAAGKDFEALDDLNRAVELAPASADARALRGAAYRRVGALELAQENLEAALTLDSGHGPAWLELGLLREATGDRAGAEVALRRAAGIDPDGPVGRSARAALARLALPR